MKASFLEMKMMSYGTAEKYLLGCKVYDRVSCKIAVPISASTLEPINNDNLR